MQVLYISKIKYKFITNKICNYKINKNILPKIESIISKLGRTAKIQANKTNRFLSKLKRTNRNLNVNIKWLFY
ncbi:hypothetical protein magtre_7 [Candidatus Hodgkinia cicadicola]|nr:hypothetical protein magtre_7 [Candidatus Hodgkinia cicadicola]